jgi:RNA polymerase sigma-70 factor (ECF subfamily)
VISPPEGDEALLASFVAGRQEAFDGLVARHRDRVFQFARWYARADRDGAEDIAAEIWIEVFRSSASFRSESSFRTWLYSIARNVCLGWIKRRGAANARLLPLEGEDDAPVEIPDGEPPVLDALERQEREKIVRAAVESLPPHHRVVLLLREWEGLSYQEIARALDLPLGTVRSRLHNALARLTLLLKTALEENVHGS